ncbi:hypothetical protein MVEG_03625 [Podila verticillata NRRL 6337]|nr:hypothetical protein MVEG_03625 [Podila verticillata NRRL 6337]
MEDKLQEKFALVQQMKREKELKEQRAKESQPFDIFSLAGVNLPSSGTAGGLNMTIRHESQPAVAPTIGSVKRPRKDRSAPSADDVPRESPASGEQQRAEEASGFKTKLKRSSMAVRNENQDAESSFDRTEADPTAMQGVESRERQMSTGSIGRDIRSPEHSKSSSSSSATPPTPIPSPKNEAGQRRGSDGSPSKPELARDMTHNVQSRSGSVDDDEEMVIDMFGRSVPRSRHHSSDEGSDSEAEGAHPRRRRRIRHEEDELDRYRPSYHGRSGRYRSRSRSRSRSHSRSPSRRHRGRSRSRSVSPYYPHSRGSDDRRRRRRGGDRERDHSGDEMPPRTPAEEVDPYQAASRYLDTAFYPTKIYVGNLPSSISLTSLRTLFAPFGDIEDMNLVEGKDFGFVTYVEPAGAQQALAKMNGAMLDGTYIRVNRAKIPERNRRGFAGVAWMDEDGELARQEEEQHQQAAAIAGSFLASSGPEGQRSGGGDSKGSRRSGEDIAALERSLNSSRDVSPSLSTSSTMSSSQPRGPVHQLPPRPRSPKLPPKPTGAASFPPMGVDPRAAMSGRGGGRQILRYDDL